MCKMKKMNSKSENKSDNNEDNKDRLKIPAYLKHDKILPDVDHSRVKESVL